jgi:hypothetical protein
MKLSDSQLNTFFAFLEEHWEEPRVCPICHGEGWDAIDVVFELRGYEISGSSAPTIMPVLPVTCKVCGNTVLFNLITAAVLSETELEGEDRLPAEEP